MALSVLTSLASRAALADPPTQTPHPAETPPDASRSVYRFDVTITGLDAGGRAAPAAYVLVLEENQPGSLSAYDNVALMAPGRTSAARADVGLRLNLSYALRGADVVAHGELELALLGAGGAAQVHHVQLRGDATLAPGATASLGRVEDPELHRRYEVRITAHRVL